MQILVLILLLIDKTFLNSLSCNTKLVSSFGYQGYLKASTQQMLFCPSVKYKCCTIEDELRFHKLWRDFYQKKLDQSFEKFIKDMQYVQTSIANFKQIDFQFLKQIIDPSNHAYLEFNWEQIKNFDETVFDQFPTLLKGVQGTENQIKQKFICYLCDLNSHQQISQIDEKIYFSENFCQNIINQFSSYLKIKLLQLDKVLLQINLIFSLIKIEDSAFQIDENYLDQIQMDLDTAQICLNSSFSLNKCANLCAKYSLHNLSSLFVNNIELQTLSIKRIEIFIRFQEVQKQAIKQIQQQQAYNELQKMPNCQSDDTSCIDKKKQLQTQLNSISLGQARILQFINTMNRNALITSDQMLNNQLGYIPLGIPQPNIQNNRLLKQKFFLQEKLRDMKKQLRKVQMEKRRLEEQKKEGQTEKPFDMSQFEALQKKIQEQIKKEYQDQIYKNVKLTSIQEMYDKIEKGQINDFSDLGWINNEFYDGDYLDSYQLGFSKLIKQPSYEIDELFNKDLQELLKKTTEIWDEKSKGFDIQIQDKSLQPMADFLNQFVELDFVEFDTDNQIAFGQMKKDDVFDEELMKQFFEKQLKQRLKIYKEMKKKQGQEEQPETETKPEQENPPRTLRRVKKRILKLKKKLVLMKKMYKQQCSYFSLSNYENISSFYLLNKSYLSKSNSLVISYLDF